MNPAALFSGPPGDVFLGKENREPKLAIPKGWIRGRVCSSSEAGAEARHLIPVAGIQYLDHAFKVAAAMPPSTFF